jgi:hypothetical protein
MKTTANQNRGGGKAAFKYQYKFDNTPVRIHLARPKEMYIHPVTGNLYPFKVIYRHWVPGAGPNHKGAFVTCDAQDKGNTNVQCVVHAYTEPERFHLPVKRIEKFTEFRANIGYAVAGWIEDWFHVVQVENRNDPSKKHFERIRCSGRGCDYCASNTPRVFGNRFYTVLSNTHWKVMTQLQLNAELFCECGKTTGPGTPIIVPDYLCEKCGEVLIDVCNTCAKCQSTNISVDPEQMIAVCQDCQDSWGIDTSANPKIVADSEKVTKCPKCGHAGYPKRHLECTNPGCTTIPRDIFDCQLTVKTTGQGKDAMLHIVEWKFQEPDSKLFDPQHQGGDMDDNKWGSKTAMAHKNCLDLNDLLKPESSHVQSALLHVDDPFGISTGVGSRPNSVPRGMPNQG